MGTRQHDVRRADGDGRDAFGQQQERADGAHQGGDDRKMPAADRHQMQYARTLEGVFKQIGVCGINTRARLAIATIWRNVILPKNT